MRFQLPLCAHISGILIQLIPNKAFLIYMFFCFCCQATEEVLCEIVTETFSYIHIENDHSERKLESHSRQLLCSQYGEVRLQKESTNLYSWSNSGKCPQWKVTKVFLRSHKICRWMLI